MFNNKIMGNNLKGENYYKTIVDGTLYQLKVL